MELTKIGMEIIRNVSARKDMLDIVEYVNLVGLALHLILTNLYVNVMILNNTSITVDSSVFKFQLTVTLAKMDLILYVGQDILKLMGNVIPTVLLHHSQTATVTVYVLMVTYGAMGNVSHQWAAQLVLDSIQQHPAVYVSMPIKT